MANDEVIGPRKTMFVLVIVVGCFAVLWPRILSPLVLGPTREQIQPNQFDREAALKQERAPPMRGMGPHPALRERGRAIPPGPPGPPPPPVRPVVLPPHVRVRSPLSVYYEVEQPPPIPGMRPPLGSPGGPVPAPKSSMGFVMPIYTICIIVFFVYTLSKILFRRTASPYDPVAPDPQFRRRVFRDDSRSSPDKLGKKEADTIVTAISGLVAEVQQQMEASYAQNQQRQDVQDNARPYTNGTILLNTGPVQIVTSEFKEAKEKTPEPVNEKEATPEPIEAEPTKVAKEPLEPDVVAPEPTVEPKESSPDIREPSPEPALTLEQKETALEIVVVNESTPVLPQTQKNNEPSLEVIETISESEVVKEPSAEIIEQPPEIPDEVVKEPISNDSLLTSVVSEVKEPVVERLVTEAIPEIDQATQESSAPEDSSDSVQILDLKHSLPDLESTVSELTETILQLKEPILELEETILESNIPIPEIEKLVPVAEEPTSVPKDSSPELKESSPVPTKPTPDDEPIPEPKEPTPEPAELSPDRKEDISETNEPIPETKESSPISEGPIPATEELIPDLNKLDTKANEPIPEPKQSSHVPKEPVSAPEEAIPELKEPATIPKEPTPEPKEPTPEPKEPTPVSEEPREGITSHTKEPISEPKEPSLEPEKLTPKPTLETKDILIDTEECELRDSSPDSKQSSPECDLDIPESKETTPDTKEITPDTNESIPDSKESIPEHPTQKHPSSELIEPSQELDAPVVERSPEPSVDTSGLKEPTPQSKEPTPEPKLTADPESIQTNQVEDSSIPEGTLIDLNEAIADKVQKEDKEEILNLKEEDIRPGDIEKDADRDASEELIKVFEGTDQKDDSATKATEKLLEEQRFVLVQSTPKVTEENNEAGLTKASDSEEEEIENAAVKVVGMELTAHPADGGAWPRDLRPARPAPAAPAPHKAEEVKSIFLETEIPQQSRVLVAQFAEDREESSDKPRPAKHAPLVVSGKMTLSLIQDAPRETPERDPESTLDDFTTASALTQPAAEKGELESDEEVDEEIEVEEIEEEYEEDDEDEEPAPVKVVKK